MSDIKPIKNREDYDEAVALLGVLIDKDPAPGTADDTKIQILTALIEDFESSTLPDYQVDPIEAIKLRIEQLGLKEKDLVPYFGSRSRVTEVLSNKRSLTVSMIKNLEEGLGIPASILVSASAEKKNKRWLPKTLALMARRGYFGEDNKDLPPKKILDLGLLRSIFDVQPLASQALLRQTNYRDISNVDQYHMNAWSNKVLTEASAMIAKKQIPPYDRDKIDNKVLSRVFKLSAEPNGVERAIGLLESLGIVVIIEPHLPGTRLDGATFFTDSNPVIGLTLRYDRLDNFWFTLAHELSHVHLHNEGNYGAFYDQLFNVTDQITAMENEADGLAGELLVPSEQWRLSPLRYGSTPTLVKMFAQKIGVHESVIAGRIRYDSKDWSIHSDMVNDERIHYLFKDKLW